MNYHAIDMNQYERKAHFEYFKSMLNPYVGVTMNVDITGFYQRVRNDAHPFFLTFLYEAVWAANSVRQFRQRIVNDAVVEFDFCGASHTVLRDNGAYAYCALNCDMPLRAFLPYAAKMQDLTREQGDIEEGDESVGRFFISSLPWLSYTSITQPTPTPADSNPRITWGKYFEQAGKLIMPVTALVNHALADGMHISRFFESLNQRLARTLD